MKDDKLNQPKKVDHGHPLPGRNDEIGHNDRDKLGNKTKKEIGGDTR